MEDNRSLSDTLAWGYNDDELAHDATTPDEPMLRRDDDNDDSADTDDVAIFSILIGWPTSFKCDDSNFHLGLPLQQHYLHSVIPWVYWMQVDAIFQRALSVVDYSDDGPLNQETTHRVSSSLRPDPHVSIFLGARQVNAK